MGETNSRGAGIVIRDHGFVLAAKALHIKDAQNAFQVEALAAYDAVEFAVDLGFKNVQIEGDIALSILKSLSNSKEDLSNICLIIDETKNMFKNFCGLSFHHINRLSNEAAHSLTNYGLRKDVDEVWWKIDHLISTPLIVKDVNKMSSISTTTKIQSQLTYTHPI